jgi:phosphoribosylaminoimidazolecarboxamide formyltransferase / IMP cyclohydrolase
MPLALLSVSDKTGLVEFASGLVQLGWDLVSTGGTSKVLRAAGLTVRDVSDLTQFPEMLDGRVKTLHPMIHGGLLARRDSSEHAETVRIHAIPWIDLVAVNLYPFRQTAAREGVSADDVVEQIDIGGPAMLRSAAKNFDAVTVICDPADYTRVLAAFEAKDDDRDLRQRLAAKVFEHTAAYDGAIAAWFSAERGERFADSLVIALERSQTLRYGENPGQHAAFYVETRGRGLDGLKQHGGKELSFNNLLDLEGALLAADAFSDQTCCAIVKHTTPCGLAVGSSPLEAYQKALACDPVSAFGSVIAFTVPVDAAAADALSSLFFECIVAPSYSPEALETLGKKKNLRVLEGTAAWPRGSYDFKRVRGGLLVQDRAPEPVPYAHWRVVTERGPTDQERDDLAFAWQAVASVKSNAIVIVRDGATIGIGAGQMSRVDASFLAVHKARGAGHDTAGAALGSDAYFPFRDGIDHAAEAGVKAIVQPGGSIRDAEVIAAANEHGIAMVFTGQRQFRH